MQKLFDLLGAVLKAVFRGKGKAVPEEKPADEDKTPAEPTATDASDDSDDSEPVELEGDGADDYKADFAAQPERLTIEEHGMADIETVLKLGDEGKKVKEFQGWLEKLGYELTRHGADGGFGDETLQEVADFQDDRREKGDNELKKTEHAIKLGGVGPKTYSAVKGDYKKLPKIPPPPKLEKEPDADDADETPDNFYKLCPDNGRGVKAKRKRKKGWAWVTGITLHQTACNMGDKLSRYKKVSAHVAITPEGKIVLMNGLDWVVYHGHSFNGSRGPGDVGIEISGAFAGLESYDAATDTWTPDEKTFWKPKSKPNRKPDSVTDEQVKATLAAIDWIVAEVERHGGKVKYLHAHRQSSTSRASDPGEKAWRLIANAAMEKHGLKDGGGKFTAGGYRIPNPWAQDSDYRAKYRSW